MIEALVAFAVVVLLVASLAQVPISMWSEELREWGWMVAGMLLVVIVLAQFGVPTSIGSLIAYGAMLAFVIFMAHREGKRHGKEKR